MRSLSALSKVQTLSMLLIAFMVSGCLPELSSTPSPVEQAEKAEAIPIGPPPLSELTPDGALFRLGNGQLAPVTLSPNGMTVLVETSIYLGLYDSATLEPRWLRPSDKEVGWSTWSPDSTLIAVPLPEENTVIMLDAETGEVDRTLEGPEERIFQVIWSPDGKHLAGGTFGSAVIWDLSSGDWDTLPISGVEELWSIALAYSPDGSMLALGRDDGLVIIWDIQSNQIKQQITTQEQYPVNSIAWSSDGTLLAIGSDNVFQGQAAVDVFDLGSGEVLYSHEGAGLCVHLRPDGQSLAASTWEGEAVIWDLLTGEEQARFEDSFCPSWLPDQSRYIAVDGQHAAIKLRDSASHETIQTLAGFSYWGWIQDVEWSSDGKRLVASASRAFEDINYLLIWSAETGELLDQIEVEGYVRSTTLSPDGQTLAAAGDSLTLWNLATAEKRSLDSPANGEEAYISMIDVAWSPDGTRLAVGMEYGTGFVGIWDVSTGEMLHQIEANLVETSSLAWAPDGSFLVSGSGSGGDVTLIDPEAGSVRWTRETGWRGEPPEDIEDYPFNDPVSGLVVSTDGQYIYAGTSWEGRLFVLNSSNGEITQTLDFEGEPGSFLEWSPDGRFIAGPSALWDAATAKFIRSFVGHQESVEAVAWSPDGQLLATASLDGTIVIWDMSNLRESE